MWHSYWTLFLRNFLYALSMGPDLLKGSELWAPMLFVVHEGVVIGLRGFIIGV